MYKMIINSYVKDFRNNKTVFIKDLNTFRKLINITKDNQIYVDNYANSIVIENSREDPNPVNKYIKNYLNIIYNENCFIFYNRWYNKIFIIMKEDLSEIEWKKLKMDIDIKFKPKRIPWEDEYDEEPEYRKS